MATASKESDGKMCETCAPKKTAAITSCHGCNRHFCRKHFNEHRDQLSNDLNNYVGLHDQIRQDLQVRIDRSLKDQLDNNNGAKRLLHQIDEWVESTINACLHVADEARASVKLLFDKTKENDSLMERLSNVARELEEQQQSENFVEHDLDRWMRQLEELKKDVCGPIEFPADVSIETRNIDWKETIKICQTSNSDKNPEHYVLLYGDRGVGKTTFIHYVANFLAYKHAYSGRLSQDTIELNRKEIIVNLNDSEETCVVDRYSFSIDNQAILVFLDCPGRNRNGVGDLIDCMKSLLNLCRINRFTAMVLVGDGTDTEENLDLDELNPNNIFESLELSETFFRVFGHFSLVFANCPPHALNINCSTFNTYDNFSVYFMQNSAYQLYRASSITDSKKADYSKSMEAIGRFIDKIVPGIHRQE